MPHPTLNEWLLSDDDFGRYIPKQISRQQGEIGAEDTKKYHIE